MSILFIVLRFLLLIGLVVGTHLAINNYKIVKDDSGELKMGWPGSIFIGFILFYFALCLFKGMASVAPPPIFDLPSQYQ
jgi:hypothetical protein